jgi:hypothetical protein
MEMDGTVEGSESALSLSLGFSFSLFLKTFKRILFLACSMNRVLAPMYRASLHPWSLSAFLSPFLSLWCGYFESVAGDGVWGALEGEKTNQM